MSKPAWLGWPLALAAALGPVVWLILYWWVRPDINVQETSANPSGIILVCLLYPLVEELAFRGYLQTKISEFPWAKVARYHITVANCCTSVLFVTVHFFYHPPIWSISIIAPSLIFGGFKDRYDSVVPGLILHCLYNSGYYLLFGFSYAG